MNLQKGREKRFREQNKDCHIPKDFSKIYQEYANLPEYLRRYCTFKDRTDLIDKFIKKMRKIREKTTKGQH